MEWSLVEHQRDSVYQSGRLEQRGTDRVTLPLEGCFTNSCSNLDAGPQMALRDVLVIRAYLRFAYQMPILSKWLKLNGFACNILTWRREHHNCSLCVYVGERECIQFEYSASINISGGTFGTVKLTIVAIFSFVVAQNERIVAD